MGWYGIHSAGATAGLATTRQRSRFPQIVGIRRLPFRPLAVGLGSGGLPVPWIRLDDEIVHHPKFVTVGPVAGWVWLCGQSYCARFLTDGFIPFGALATAFPSGDRDVLIEQAVNRLESAGLWERVERGWQVHDYLHYQPSRQDVERQRNQKRKAGIIGGHTAGRGRPKSNGRQTVRQKTGNGQAEG